jgi:hypothetical protein
MEAFLALAGHPPCPDPAGQHAADVTPPAVAAAAAEGKGVRVSQKQREVIGWGDVPINADAEVDGW